MSLSRPHYIYIDKDGKVSVSFYDTYAQACVEACPKEKTVFAEMGDALRHYRWLSADLVVRSLQSFGFNARDCYMRCDPVAVYGPSKTPKTPKCQHDGCKKDCDIDLDGYEDYCEEHMGYYYF